MKLLVVLVMTFSCTVFAGDKDKCAANIAALTNKLDFRLRHAVALAEQHGQDFTELRIRGIIKIENGANFEDLRARLVGEPRNRLSLISPQIATYEASLQFLLDAAAMQEVVAIEMAQPLRREVNPRKQK